MDTTDSTFAGQTYTTAIDLPSDFCLPAPYIYVGTEKYPQVPFERAVEYRDSTGYYYVDTANGGYQLCGHANLRPDRSRFHTSTRLPTWSPTDRGFSPRSRT